jgi:hypothetical protein
MAIGCAVQSDVAIAHQLNVLNAERIDQHIMHARANIFAAHAGEADSDRHQIVAMNHGPGAGLVDRFAKCRDAACYADSERIGRPGGTFTQNAIAIEHDCSRSGSTAIDSNDELAQGRKPPRHNFYTLRDGRHQVIRCPGGLLRFLF